MCLFTKQKKLPKVRRQNFYISWRSRYIYIYIFIYFFSQCVLFLASFGSQLNDLFLHPNTGSFVPAASAMGCISTSLCWWPSLHSLDFFCKWWPTSSSFTIFFGKKRSCSHQNSPKMEFLFPFLPFLDPICITEDLPLKISPSKPKTSLSLWSELQSPTSHNKRPPKMVIFKMELIGTAQNIRNSNGQSKFSLIGWIKRHKSKSILVRSHLDESNTWCYSILSITKWCFPPLT